MAACAGGSITCTTAAKHANRSGLQGGAAAADGSTRQEAASPAQQQQNMQRGQGCRVGGHQVMVSHAPQGSITFAATKQHAQQGRVAGAVTADCSQSLYETKTLAGAVATLLQLLTQQHALQRTPACCYDLLPHSAVLALEPTITLRHDPPAILRLQCCCSCKPFAQPSAWLLLHSPGTPLARYC
jgi:hypothetical protein